MMTYIFFQGKAPQKFKAHEDHIQNVLKRVGEGTDTKDLVVSVYLLDKTNSWGGICFRKWCDKEKFQKGRGSWSATKIFPLPQDLPERFKLIRMKFGAGLLPYPRILRDRYGWAARYPSFEAHLATLFAHELHHFRRYHLNLHHREGEHSTNAWALQRVNEVGFEVEGGFADRTRKRRERKLKAKLQGVKRLPKENPQLRRKVIRMANHLSLEDVKYLRDWCQKRERVLARKISVVKKETHYEKIRALPEGTQLVLTRDLYRELLHKGNIVTKIKNLKTKSSKRVEVKDQGGTLWHIPMDFLDVSSLSED